MDLTKWIRLEAQANPYTSGRVSGIIIKRRMGDPKPGAKINSENQASLCLMDARRNKPALAPAPAPFGNQLTNERNNEARH